jgi:hypothetical protein
VSTALVTSADALARPVVWHLGQLHAFENWLALLLAFGPFVILAVVIVVRRRDDDDDLDGAEEPRQT